MKRTAVHVLLIGWLLIVTVLIPIFIGGIVTEMFYPGMFWWLGIVAGVGVLYFLFKGPASLSSAWRAALKPNWKDSPTPSAGPH
jgi:hypothetical protein